MNAVSTGASRVAPKSTGALTRKRPRGAELLDHRLRRLDLGQHAAATLVLKPSGIVEALPPGRAMHQRRAEPILQGPNMLTGHLRG